MTPQDLVELLEYDRWATERVLDAAEAAGRTFLEPKGASVGSVRDLMVHVGDAQVRWLGRLKGEPIERERLERYTTVAQTRAHCGRANALVKEHVAALAQAGLDQEVRHRGLDGNDYSTPARQILLQLFYHGIHHRAEACELLSQAGHAPEPVELIQFYRTRARKAAGP